MTLRDHHVPSFDPVAAEGATVVGDDCRFTVLTPRLVRLEHDPDGEFEDRPTQTVWYRDHPVPEFEVESDGERVVVETEALRLTYDPGGVGLESDDASERDRTDADGGIGFTPDTLAVEVFDTDTVWRYGDDPDGNLGGTVRTLDQVDGATALGEGLCSRDGWAVLDDTDSLVFGDDGWVETRGSHDAEDLYLFAHGRDYPAALADLARITGDPPIPPRWALGNWWSRYWEYEGSELLDLMREFRERDLPLAVCVVDMDWHVVENPHHDGWTGFTWNRDLFPDPEGFLDALDGMGLHSTLNLHPAQGVHPHEAAYEAVAERVGVDPGTEEPVPFDASDTDFLAAYFEELLHPLEAQGVDFWWVDWQQWRASPELEGLDPLWALNHLHAFDRTRDGRRPFLLSRWGGVGGHRYPVGFSGDTVASWESLAFQPPMTATAANVGCGWWSHDIGGHYGGSGSPGEAGERYARWVQFGLFSPVLRIHATKAPYIDRRPWRHDPAVREAVGDALRRRHAFVPYLYTVARRYHETGLPPVRPTYYHHPDAPPAYAPGGGYYLGSELLVAPHVRPRDDETGLSRTAVWLPESTPGDGGADGDASRWFDFHTGAPRESGWHVRHGDLSDVPAYAPAGAVVPLGPEVGWGGLEPPEELRVVVFPGADGELDLYEDDGETTAYRDGACATTTLRTEWAAGESEDDSGVGNETTAGAESMTLSVDPVEGDSRFVPDEREVAFHVRGVRADAAVVGSDHAFGTDEDEHGSLVVTLPAVAAEEGATVTVSAEGGTDAPDSLLAHPRPTAERVRDLLWQADLWVHTKPDVEAALRAASWDALNALPDFRAVLPDGVARALVETCHDVGVDRQTGDSETLVLWNAEGSAEVTYRFAAWHPGGHPAEHDTARQGIVPTFEAIDLGDYEGMRWELVVEYGDAATVRYEGEA